MTEILIIAVVIIFFLSLSLYAVMTNVLYAPLTLAQMDQGQHAQAEKFPWGTAWVFDNDRERQSPSIPILFIHGLGGSIYSWRYQLEELAKTQPVVAIDLLGFGRSSKSLDQPYGLDGHARRILDILDAKQIPSCHIVGCSLGGALALWLTSQHPDRFPKIIAISPAAVASLARVPNIAYNTLGGVGQRVISRPIIKKALHNGMAHHHKITDEIIETYLSPFKDPGAMACFFKTIATIKDIRIFESLKNIQNPVLILRGHGDRVINRRIIEQIKNANSQFSILEHPQGGHHLMEDEPEWVNDKILSFFELKS